MYMAIFSFNYVFFYFLLGDAKFSSALPSIVLVPCFLHTSSESLQLETSSGSTPVSGPWEASTDRRCAKNPQSQSFVKCPDHPTCRPRHSAAHWRRLSLCALWTRLFNPLGLVCCLLSAFKFSHFQFIRRPFAPTAPDYPKVSRLPVAPFLLSHRLSLPSPNRWKSAGDKKRRQSHLCWWLLQVHAAADVGWRVNA